MHEVLVNRLGGLSLSRKSVVRLTDRPDMTLDVYRGRKTTIQQQQLYILVQSILSIVFDHRAFQTLCRAKTVVLQGGCCLDTGSVTGFLLCCTYDLTSDFPSDLIQSSVQ